MRLELLDRPVVRRVEVHHQRRLFTAVGRYQPLIVGELERIGSNRQQIARRLDGREAMAGDPQRARTFEDRDRGAHRRLELEDPRRRRVTRVGRFIRKTSLDELPQLFNVLKGELSLVGPRPHATEAKAKSSLYQDVVKGYFARHRVRPGITGLAQVNGWRGETDTREKIVRRVEHDLFYIENWSVLFDLRILLKTPVSLLKTENAY